MVRRAVSREELRMFSRMREASRARAIERSEDDALLACCAYTANSDGTPNLLEERFIRDYLATNSRGEGDYVRISISSLDSMTREVAATTIRSYRLVCRPSLTHRRRLIDGLLRLASCDADLNNCEISAIREICGLLGLPVEKHSILRKLLGVSRPHRARGKGPRPRVSQRATAPSRHQWCYEVLGCSETDSDEMVKRAYRQLASKLHPDKHAGAGPKQESALDYQREFQRLQEAYTELKRVRPALR